MLSERPHGPLLLEASGVLLEQISQERSGGVGRHGGRACVRLCGCEGGALSEKWERKRRTKRRQTALGRRAGEKSGIVLGGQICGERASGELKEASSETSSAKEKARIREGETGGR